MLNSNNTFFTNSNIFQNCKIYIKSCWMTLGMYVYEKTPYFCLKFLLWKFLTTWFSIILLSSKFLEVFKARVNLYCCKLMLNKSSDSDMLVIDMKLFRQFLFKTSAQWESVNFRFYPVIFMMIIAIRYSFVIHYHQKKRN